MRMIASGEGVQPEKWYVPGKDRAGNQGTVPTGKRSLVGFSSP